MHGGVESLGEKKNKSFQKGFQRDANVKNKPNKTEEKSMNCENKVRRSGM